MAGKNKIELATALIYDDTGGTARTLSGDLVPGSLSVAYGAEEVDMTGSSDTIANKYNGRLDCTVTAQFYMNDTATTGAYTVLINQLGTNTSTGYTLTCQWGSAGATPTTGDPEFEGEFVLKQLDFSTSGGAHIMSATWRPKANETAPAWGTVA